MLRLEQVLQVVAPHLDAVASSEGRPIVVTAAERIGARWRIIYNTVDFVASGDPMDGLVGNHPLQVTDDGSITGWADDA